MRSGTQASNTGNEMDQQTQDDERPTDDAQHKKRKGDGAETPPPNGLLQPAAGFADSEPNADEGKDAGKHIGEQSATHGRHIRSNVLKRSNIRGERRCSDCGAGEHRKDCDFLFHFGFLFLWFFLAALLVNFPVERMHGKGASKRIIR